MAKQYVNRIIFIISLTAFGYFNFKEGTSEEHDLYFWECMASGAASVISGFIEIVLESQNYEQE